MSAAALVQLVVVRPSQDVRRRGGPAAALAAECPCMPIAPSMLTLEALVPLSPGSLDLN